MAGPDSPWQPASLRGHEDIGAFAYVVVEEEIDGTMGLVVAPWPAGGGGAPRFHDEGEFELAVDREALQRHLKDRRLPEAVEHPELSAEVVEELRGRRVEVGDAFAIRPLHELDPDLDPELLASCEWIGEVIDVTAAAREAAKVRMFEALTPPLDPGLAKQMIAESGADEDAGAGAGA